MDRIKVKQIKLNNILGLRDAEIDFTTGDVIEITGRNAAGKTSILEGIRGALEGGHDATLIRRGEQEGEAVIVFEDGGILTKTFRPDKDTLKFEHPDMGRISRPAQYIEKLCDALSLNPIDFLTAKPKDRAAMLLEAMPLKVTSEQIAAITGKPEHVKGYAFACNGRHALDILSEVERNQFEERTGVNRALKEKQATIEQLGRTVPLPPETTEDWQSTIEQYQQQLVELTAEHTAQLGAVDAEAAQKKHAAETQCAEAVRVATKARDAAIDAAKEEERQAIEAIRLKTATAILAATGAYNTAQAEHLAQKNRAVHAIDATLTPTRAAVNEQYEPKAALLQEQLGTARAMMEQDARAAQTRRIMDDMTADAARLKQQADKLTLAIDGLRALKTRLTESLPIPGLEIRDGEIFVDGIPYDRVNESRRIRIAIDVAKLRAKAVPLLLVDGLERLDSSAFRTFCDEAKKSGLQLIVSRVADSDLTIRALGQEEAEASA